MTDRQILINLIASLSLCDHMGDAYEDCEQALKQANIDISGLDDDSDPWPDLAQFLARQHNAVTIWGTSLPD